MTDRLKIAVLGKRRFIPSGPVNVTLPVISGTASVGQTITAAHGSWTNSPTLYTYVWRRDGAPIAGETGTTYVAVSGDLGTVLTCTVTALNAVGSASATSNSISFVATDSSISVPTITLAVGQLVYPPQFDIGLDDTHQVGDTLRIQQANDNGFTSGVVNYDHVITAGEAIAHALALTGLSAISSGTHRYRPFIIRGAVSSSSPSTFITHGPDNQAPTLSSVTDTPAATTAAIGCTTDENNGTLYVVVTATNSAPSKAQIKAGQTSAGGTPVYAGNQAITSTGAKSFSVTGLTGGTPYYDWFMHEDATGNQSTVLGASFTTITGSVAVLVAGTGLSGAGTDRSRYIDTSGTPVLVYACNADVGAACLVRSVDIPPTKAHFENKCTALAAVGDRILIGVSDSAVALGAAVFTYPGQTGAGCTLRALGNTTSWVLFANGTNTAVTAPAGLAVNDYLVCEFDQAAHTVSFWVVRSGTPTLITSVTLTSNIPTNWTAMVGADASNGDSGLTNFGASAWAKAPTATYSGW